jgi:hypothetical protein
VLIGYAASSLPADRASDAVCRPITFEVLGSPPPLAGAELEVAMQEIHERTGFVFEPASASGGAERPTLSIVWTGDETPRPPSDLVVADDGARRRLGFGAGRWRYLPDRRELVEAVVEINGDVAWGQGLGSADGLAAVFVHELGHVIGLQHNADPASFMYRQARHQPPTWTAEDASQLAWFGRQSGCEPSGDV